MRDVDCMYDQDVLLMEINYCIDFRNIIVFPVACVDVCGLIVTLSSLLDTVKMGKLCSTI